MAPWNYFSTLVKERITIITRWLPSSYFPLLLLTSLPWSCHAISPFRLPLFLTPFHVLPLCERERDKLPRWWFLPSPPQTWVQICKHTNDSVSILLKVPYMSDDRPSSWTSGFLCTGWCKKQIPLFEIPALLLPGKLASPCISQTANFGTFKLNSLNLGAFFSLLSAKDKTC